MRKRTNWQKASSDHLFTYFSPFRAPSEDGKTAADAAAQKLERRRAKLQLKLDSSSGAEKQDHSSRVLTGKREAK